MLPFNRIAYNNYNSRIINIFYNSLNRLISLNIFLNWVILSSFFLLFYNSDAGSHGYMCIVLWSEL